MKKLMILLLVPLILCSCSYTADNKSVDEFFAMDTVMTVSVWGDTENGDAVSAVRDEIMRLDNLLSISAENGDIAKANSLGTVKLSDDAENIIQSALDIYDITDGAFDITLYSLSKRWGFYSGEYDVPNDDEISELLRNVGCDKVRLEDSMLYLKDGVKIDLGGIAKGYASDRAAEILREKGIESAVISLGGNVYAIGSNGGKPWNVAIREPNSADAYIGVIKVCDTAVVTSGTYQRYFEQDGVRYHHILDPNTGKPVNSGLCSVTVVCKNGTYADGLSTALLVMGLEKAVDFLRGEEYYFDAVFVTDDEQIYITPGLEGSFSSDKPYEVLEK